MALSWFEMDLPLQIYVPCRKESLVKIRIQGTDRHVQLRVACQDMIGGLSLFDQRENALLLFAKLLFCHVDPHSGTSKLFVIFSVGRSGIIVILVGNRAVIDFFRTAVADIRSPVKPYAALFFRVFAGLGAGRTGCAFDSAQDNLSTGIRLLTVIAVDAPLCVFGKL